MKAAATSPTMLIPRHVALADIAKEIAYHVASYASEHIPKEITDAAELGVHLSGYSVHRINGFTSLARQTLHIVGGFVPPLPWHSRR